MSTYSADISVKVLGLSSLKSLENRVELLQDRFSKLNAAAAKVAAPFQGHIEALERLNTLLVANGKLLNEQAEAVKRMDRVAGRSNPVGQTDPRIEKERTSELMRQLGLLKERARASDSYVQVMAKLLRAEVEISAAVGGNVALGKELMKNARALLAAEERVAAAKAKGAAQAIKAAEAERDARLRAVAELERAEERRIRNQERAEDRLNRNRERARQQEERAQYIQERRNSRDSRTVANFAGRVGGAVDGAFGNVFSRTGKALEGAAIRGGATAGLLGTAGVVAAGEKLSILGQNLIPQMTGAAGAVESLLNALAQVPGGMGAAAVAAAAFAPWLPKIAEGAYAAGDAVGKLKPAQPIKNLLKQGGPAIVDAFSMNSEVNAMSGNLDMALDTSGYERAASAAAAAFTSRFKSALMGKLGQGILDQLQKESDQYFSTLTRNQKINASWAAVLEEGAAHQARITRDAQAEAKARDEMIRNANISAAENRIGGLRYAIREATGDRFNSGTAQQNAQSIADMRARGQAATTQLNAIRRANPNQYDSRGAMPGGNDIYKQSGYLQAANTKAARAQLAVESKTLEVRYSWIKALREGAQIQKDIVAAVKAEELAAKKVTAEEIRKSRIRASQATREARAQKLRDKKEYGERLPESMMLGVGFPLMFGAGPASILGSAIGSTPMFGKGFGGQIFVGALGMMVDQFAAAAQTTAASLRDPIASFEELKTAGMFANREQERLIERLIELGQVSEAAARIQDEVVRKIGNSGLRDMQALDETTVRLSKAWAELTIQMQALAAGPLAEILAMVSGAVGRQTAANRIDALQGDLAPEQRKQLDARIKQELGKPLAGSGIPEWLLGGGEATAENIVTLPTATLEKLYKEFEGQRPAAPAKPLSEDNRLKEATASLEKAERAEALRRQGVQLERAQMDARQQIEDQVYGLRQRAADLERANIDLRRSVEDEIFRKRQELARIESDNAREQARLAIERTDLQLSAIQAEANAPGADIANGLVAAVRQYVKTRAEAEADFQQKERNFKIEMVELAKASDQFRFDVERKVADLQRQSVEFNRDVTRARINAERTIFDLQVQAADYALAQAKARIELEQTAANRLALTLSTASVVNASPLSLLIGSRESYGGNYGAFNRGGSNQGHTAHGSGIDPNLTNMSIAEIQRRQLAPGVPRNQQLHAVGKYQIIGETLRNLLRGNYGPTGVTASDTFTPEVQEKLFAALARNRVVPGDVNATMRGLRQEWIGLQYVSDKELRPAAEQLMAGAKSLATAVEPEKGNQRSDGKVYTGAQYGYQTVATARAKGLLGSEVLGDGSTPPAAAPAAAAPASAPVPRPVVDTSASLAGLNLRAPSVGGVGDLMATVAAVDTGIAKAKQTGLELAKAYSQLTKEQATAELTKQFKDAVTQLNAPMDQLLDTQRDQLAFQREYAGLIAEGVTPELAEQVVKIQEQVGLQLKQLDTTIALQEVMKLKLTAAGKWTQELEDQLKILKSQKAVITGKGQEAISNAKTAESPEQRLQNAFTTARGELTKLQDPVNQIVAGANAIGTAFADSFKGVVSGSMSAREALANFFQSTADHFLNMASQMIAKYLEMQLIGLAQSLLAPAVGGLGTAATGFGGALPVPRIGGARTGFAEGGYVTGPTNAVVGEGGEPEYIIPESKMGAAMQRYSAGGRGPGVISGSGGDSERSGGATTATIDVGYRVTEINSVRYVTESEFQAGMQQAAQQGAAAGHQRVMGDFRNKRSVRTRMGIN